MRHSPGSPGFFYKQEKEVGAYFETNVPLIFNPELLGGSRSNGKGWWIVGEAEASLGKYLRKLYAMYTYHTSLLMRPAWADHITIVRDEFPVISQERVGWFWDKWRDRKIHCTVVLEPEFHNGYWTLPVYSEAACVLRKDLGLSREPLIPLHLSFGHVNVIT